MRLIDRDRARGCRLGIGDRWRLGLLFSALVIAAGVPPIAFFWSLG